MADVAIHSGSLLVAHTAMKRGETKPEHPWWKYSSRNDRILFQKDLAYSLMEKGLIMDCPDVANLKKPKMKKYLLCECGKCFFCKYRITYGVQHKKSKILRLWVPLPGQPESEQEPPPPPSQH
jgi:hypothetical protein